MYQHWFFKKSPIDKVGYWKIIPSCLESVCVWSWEGGVAVRRSLRHGLWENLKWKEWFMVQTRQGVVITCVKLAFVSIIWCGSGPREVRWDSRTLCEGVWKKGHSSFQRLCSHTGKMGLSINVFLLWATGTQSPQDPLENRVDPPQYIPSEGWGHWSIYWPTSVTHRLQVTPTGLTPNESSRPPSSRHEHSLMTGQAPQAERCRRPSGGRGPLQVTFRTGKQLLKTEMFLQLFLPLQPLLGRGWIHWNGWFHEFTCLPNPFSVSSVQSHSRVWLFATPWNAACLASLSITNPWSLLKLTSIALAMPSNHLIICRPLLLSPSIFPSIRVFSNESVLHNRWPKYCSYSFSITPSNEYWGLISFRMDWLDLLAVQGTLKSLLQHHSSKTSILRHSVFFTVQLSHPYMTTGKTIALTRWTFIGKVMSLPFNTLSRLVIVFLPRSKHLLVSWLQSPSAVILEP